jgi:hypothetical protein
VRPFEFELDQQRYALVRGGRPALAPDAAAGVLRRALERDAFLRASAARWARRSGLVLGLADGPRVLAGLLRDVGTGWVRVHALEPAPRPTYTHTLPEQGAPLPASTREDAPTWVEAILEDEDGTPLADVGYRLTLPDGSLVEGRTDEAGRVYVDPVPPGECRIELRVPLLPHP